MERQLKPKENYLYGRLLALVREQHEAIEKRDSGQLGMWGKGRIGARSNEIKKVMIKIVREKEKAGCEAAAAAGEMLDDLNFIESDNGVWSGTDHEDMQAIRAVMEAFLKPSKVLLERAIMFGALTVRAAERKHSRLSTSKEIEETLESMYGTLSIRPDKDQRAKAQMDVNSLLAESDFLEELLEFIRSKGQPTPEFWVKMNDAIKR